MYEFQSIMMQWSMTVYVYMYIFAMITCRLQVETTEQTTDYSNDVYAYKLPHTMYNSRQRHRLTIDPQEFA